MGELVEMTRKMLLSGLIIFVAPGTSMQIVVALFLSMGFLLMHSLWNPFEDSYENRAQVWTLRGAALTVLTGLLIMSTAGTCKHEQNSLGTETMTGLLLLSNFVVFGILLFVTLEVKQNSCFYDTEDVECYRSGITSCSIKGNSRPVWLS